MRKPVVLVAISTLVYAFLCDAVFAQSKQGSDAPSPRGFSEWRLPPAPPHPDDNQPSANRILLGKMLFFDPRLSRDRTMSCASCHNPSLGWSDGLATARGFQGRQLDRKTPSIINAGFNTLFMWDGRHKSLEGQAIGPLEAESEMNTDMQKLFAWIGGNQGYRNAFARAYPGEAIGPGTVGRALAAYERTVVSRNSPFDRWLAGDRRAMTSQQLRGMLLFTDRNRANCAACHAPPNFTDNGFHNLGLASQAIPDADPGRYRIKPVALMKGAFKTPALRDVERTAPYFHDGSAKTLMEVVEHYDRGGDVKANLSPNMKPLNLTRQDKEDLVAFMKALTSPSVPVSMPVLPKD